MQTVQLAVAAAALIVGLTVLVKKNADLSSFPRAAIYLLEVAVILASVIAFGWWGLAIGMGVLVVAILVSAVRLAMQLESVLVSATARGRLTMSKHELRAFHRELRRSHRAFRYLGALPTADLIRLLSERGRDSSEITAIAPIVAKLWVIHDVDRETLTDRFDRLLRLWGKSAHEAEEVADQLIAASKASAATFEEMLDAMIALATDPVEP